MSLKTQVLAGLQANDNNRNSDITLMLWIWENYYGVTEDNFTFSKLYELPTQENIKRYRARIQNEEGKYLPTNTAVQKKRQKLNSKWKIDLGYGSIHDYIILED